MSHPARTSPESPSWTDRPLAELVRLTWPIAVSMLSYSAMTLVDTLFVAGLGRAELAAVGLGGVATFTFLCFSIGMLRGVKVLVSQAVGAGRSGDAATYRAAGVVLGLGLGLVTVAAALVASPVVEGLASSGRVGILAGDYLAVRILSAPILLVFVALRESRYGEGDARSPMIAGVSANVLNIGLDYLLIYVWDGGVTGAAWASCASVAWEALVLLWVCRSDRWPGVRAGIASLRPLWRVGVPTGVQFLLEVGSFSMLTAIIAAMAEVELAAHNLVLQALHFSFLPMVALSEAGSVLAGQAVGARREELVNAVAARAVAIAAGYAALCTVICVFVAPALLAGFVTDIELVRVATSLFYIAAVFQFADGANVIARGILRGTGDVRVPAIVGIITAWVAVPPLAWLLGLELGMGALGGWIGLCVELFAGAGVFWWRLARGHWRAAAAVTRNEVETRPLAASA